MPDNPIELHTPRMKAVRTRVQNVARAWNVPELEAAYHVISYLHLALEQNGIAVPLEIAHEMEARKTDPLPPKP